MTTTTLSPVRARFAMPDVPWAAWLASLTLAVFALAALAPGLLATHDPQALDFGATLQAPSTAHWFGTDESGRDLYSRIVHGAAQSLAIGLGATAVSLSIALVLGTVAGLGAGGGLGGRLLAGLVGRVIEILFAFPTLLLALLLIAVTGPSAMTQVLAVGIGTAPGYARMIRGQVLAVKGSGHVEAAVVLGHSRARIVRRHVLPGALRPLVAIFTLAIGQSIVWASGLSFLGLGVAPPSPEWGALLDAGRAYVVHAGWLVVIPGLVIVVLALAATALGRHLQSVLEKGER